MDSAEHIKKLSKEKDFSQQEVAVSMNREQYNRIETSKSKPTINILQWIATILGIKVLEFFEADKNSMEVPSINEQFFQKGWLLEERRTLRNEEKIHLQYDWYRHCQQTPHRGIN